MSALDNSSTDLNSNELLGENIALSAIFDALLFNEINYENFEYFRLQILLKAANEKLNQEIITSIDKTFSEYKHYFEKPPSDQI